MWHRWLVVSDVSLFTAWELPFDTLSLQLCPESRCSGSWRWLQCLRQRPDQSLQEAGAEVSPRQVRPASGRRAEGGCWWWLMVTTNWWDDLESRFSMIGGLHWHLSWFGCWTREPHLMMIMIGIPTLIPMHTSSVPQTQREDNSSGETFKRITEAWAEFSGILIYLNINFTERSRRTENWWTLHFFEVPCFEFGVMLDGNSRAGQ